MSRRHRPVSEQGERKTCRVRRVGGQDAVFSREDPERLAAAIPGATLKVYPETGHAVHWERPEQVVQDLERFMKTTRSA
jgi:non-heme chloroperoxidase